ncbi:MAG: hypothetical protein V7K21_18660 [Nostoc sp.]|uniref:hypothetical protein n=1 Tax=Nostoc sp. TaxID=1180 RepID=UPI002FF848B6
MRCLLWATPSPDIICWVEAMRYPTFCMVCWVTLRDLATFLKRHLLQVGRAAQRTGSPTYTKVIL